MQMYFVRNDEINMFNQSFHICERMQYSWRIVHILLKQSRKHRHTQKPDMYIKKENDVQFQLLYVNELKAYLNISNAPPIKVLQ